MTNFINSDIRVESLLYVYPLNASSDEWVSVFIGMDEHSITKVYLTLSKYDYKEHGRFITDINELPVEAAITGTNIITVGCADISAVLRTDACRTMEIEITDFTGFPEKESANENEEISIPVYF